MTFCSSLVTLEVCKDSYQRSSACCFHPTSSSSLFWRHCRSSTGLERPMNSYFARQRVRSISRARTWLRANWEEPIQTNSHLTRRSSKESFGSAMSSPSSSNKSYANSFAVLVKKIPRKLKISIRGGSAWESNGMKKRLTSSLSLRNWESFARSFSKTKDSGETKSLSSRVRGRM